MHTSTTFASVAATAVVVAVAAEVAVAVVLPSFAALARLPTAFDDPTFVGKLVCPKVALVVFAAHKLNL